MLIERLPEYPKSALSNYMLLIKSASDAGFAPRFIGFDGYFPMFIFSSKHKAGKPSRCVDVLTHGDEVAPFFALLGLLLVDGPNLAKNINLSFILKNPTGFALGTRNDVRGDDPNKGFIKGTRRRPLIGQLMIRHKKIILPAGADGYLTMHEDSDIPDRKKGGGVFCYSESGVPSERMAKRLLSVAAPILGIASCGILFRLEKCGPTDAMVSPGIVREGPSSSLEHALSREGLTSLVMETPSKEIPLSLRVVANARMIRSFSGV